MAENFKHSDLLVAIHGSYFCDNFGDTYLLNLTSKLVHKIVGKKVFLAIEGNIKEQNDIGIPILEPKARAKVTHLIYGPGGYFGEPFDSEDRYLNKQWTIRNYDRHFSWANDFKNAKILVFGLEVGPISDSQYLDSVRKLFSKSYFNIVRNSESFEFCNTHNFDMSNIFEGCDLALIKPSIMPIDCSVKENIIILHLAGLSSEKKDMILSLVVKNFKNFKINIISDNSGGNDDLYDLYRITSTKFNLENIKIIKYSKCEDLIKLLTKSKIVITTKLHVGIIGIMNNLKVISIPLHQKIPRFYKQVKLSEFCIPPALLDCNSLLNALKNPIYNPSFLQANMRLSKMIEILNNFLLIKAAGCIESK